MVGDRHRYAAAVLAALLIMLGLLACSVTEGPPFPTWPVAVEALPAATSPSADSRRTCSGGRTFPAASLDAPTGAETETGPAFDALREGLAKFGGEIPGSAGLTWSTADMDSTGATFLAKSDAIDPLHWLYVEVGHDANGWQPWSMGGCDMSVVLSTEFGPASWATDPSYPRPVPETTELHILVWEQMCSNGSPATGRMSAPVIEYAADTVTITIGVRPITVPEGFAVTCPGPAGTPASLRLTEPLGSRTLLDGGHVPAAAPSPMF